MDEQDIHDVLFLFFILCILSIHVNTWMNKINKMFYSCFSFRNFLLYDTARDNTIRE